MNGKLNHLQENFDALKQKLKTSKEKYLQTEDEMKILQMELQGNEDEGVDAYRLKYHELRAEFDKKKQNYDSYIIDKGNYFWFY